jgi:hypothetical protein
MVRAALTETAIATAPAWSDGALLASTCPLFLQDIQCISEQI